MFRNKEVLIKAASQLGVKEAPGAKDNPQVVEYHKYSTLKNLVGLADSVPWCTSFVCWVLEKVGMGSTNSTAARSFLKWGVSTFHDALPGDVIVFWRGSKNGWQGHVGILLAKKGNLLYVLGGNQADSVNISSYTDAKLLDIRRSSKVPFYTAEQRAELHELAAKIMAGESVQEGGKVV